MLIIEPLPLEMLMRPLLLAVAATAATAHAADVPAFHGAKFVAGLMSDLLHSTFDGLSLRTNGDPSVPLAVRAQAVF